MAAPGERASERGVATVKTERLREAGGGESVGGPGLARRAWWTKTHNDDALAASDHSVGHSWPSGRSPIRILRFGILPELYTNS